MASKYKQLLEGQAAASQARQTSLSDRLSELDKYRTSVQPIQIGQISNMEARPEGFNPIRNFQALAQTIAGEAGIRSAASQDLERAEATGVGLLGQLAKLEDEASSAASRFDLMKEMQLAKELGLDVTQYEAALGKQRGDPEELETYNLIKDIKEADLGPLTGTLRVRGGQLAENLGIVNEYTDTRKKVQQLVDRLALKSREAIKGTGTISDAEQEMLKNAQTFLKGNLSEKAFRKELDRLENEAIANLGYTPETVAGTNEEDTQKSEQNYIEDWKGRYGQQ